MFVVDVYDFANVNIVVDVSHLWPRLKCRRTRHWTRSDTENKDECCHDNTSRDRSQSAA